MSTKGDNKKEESQEGEEESSTTFSLVPHRGDPEREEETPRSE